ncbi:MAG: signal peptidase II [Lachnospiraceae bacterium]|nr:signal peptidase II [Lachnospiraceae bacterium]
MRKELCLCAGTALADLALKAAFRKFKPRQVVFNHGFAANRLEGHPEAVAGVSAGMTGFLTAIWLDSIRSKDSSPLKRIGLSLCLGGAVSNTVERIISRRVTDYLPLGKYVYNLGDFAIYTGSILEAAAELFQHK